MQRSLALDNYNFKISFASRFFRWLPGVPDSYDVLTTALNACVADVKVVANGLFKQLQENESRRLTEAVQASSETFLHTLRETVLDAFSGGDQMKTERDARIEELDRFLTGHRRLAQKLNVAHRKLHAEMADTS